MIEDRHKRKFLDFVITPIKNIKFAQILEFGVSEKGMSTGIFLELCDKNNGKLTSVDINNNSKKFENKNWKFINSRDDDFLNLDKEIPKELDVIYLDTIHKANHVQKIIYHYYNKLKVGGFFFVDDISWIPYLKDNEKNNYSLEINNQETFETIIDIYNNNRKNFDLEFSFVGTGVAKLVKLSSEDLSKRKKIKSRKISLMSVLRKFYLLFKSTN
ncbi:class I SAM-dependent methyltransferase [Candidatus Pelagibacter sp.]|nr:class I SAM-dependent methyltransferase [Candidatus Pelagibacter sp.]